MRLLKQEPANFEFDARDGVAEEDEVRTTMIKYLYGDSTPSPLTTNYIAHLHNIFDFAVEVLLHENRASATRHAVEHLSDLTDAEVFLAEEVVALVFRALERYPTSGDKSIAARCAARIRQGVDELVCSEARAARAVVTMEKARAAQIALISRGACAKAFEKLVQHRDLPESVVTTKVWLEGESRYVARRLGRTPYGLQWTVEVGVPASNGFGRVLRVSSVARRVEIEVPTVAGWFHKGLKLRPHRFDRLYLVELVVEPSGVTMKLRTSPHISSAGYDVCLPESSSRVGVTRTPQGSAAPDSPYEVSDEDAAALRSVRDALVALVEELPVDKQALVSASLDDTSLHHLDSPRLLVERLIAGVAPAVEQISRRSPVPGELALKRVLGETQREEIFVSKEELRKKLEPLPAALRGIFAPLQLWDETELIAPPQDAAEVSAGENKPAVVLQGHRLLDASAHLSREWSSEPTGGHRPDKRPALHPASLSIAET